MDRPLRTYALFRDINPSVTREDWDAGAVRSLVATGMYTSWTGGQIGWVRSFWEPAGDWGMCVYEAQSLEEIEWFNRECSFTAIDIREIHEVVPPIRKGSGELSVVQGPPAAVETMLTEGGLQPLRHYREDEDVFAIAIVEGTPATTAPDVMVKRVVELLPQDYM